MHHTSLATATFLCSLVAGFLFAFATIVMPGLRTLDDRDFLRAFQVIDRVIQNNHPFFVLVWVGSIFAVVVAAVLGMAALTGLDRVLLVVAAVVYLLGVQLPTMTINVPLNNQLQEIALGSLNREALEAVRSAFEVPWNRWNTIRTGFASLSVGLMLSLLTRL